MATYDKRGIRLDEEKKVPLLPLAQRGAAAPVQPAFQGPGVQGNARAAPTLPPPAFAQQKPQPPFKPSPALIKVGLSSGPGKPAEVQTNLTRGPSRPVVGPTVQTDSNTIPLAASSALIPEANAATGGTLPPGIERGASGGFKFDDREGQHLFATPGQARNALGAPLAQPGDLSVVGRPQVQPLAQSNLVAPPVGSQGADVIRGTNVQARGQGAGGVKSPIDLFRDYIALNLREGGDPNQFIPHLELLAELEKNTQGASGLPSLSQVQGQRFGALAQNPGAITDADRLVFGKGAQGQLYKQPTYDNVGTKTGETPYLLDQEGNAKPVKIPGAGKGAGAAPPPSLGAFLAAARNDPRNADVPDAELVNHYNQAYRR